MHDDKGGEYMSREFEAFCIDYGIQRQHTAQNCPQQNGIAERANSTLEEGIISILHESGMPPSFWGEALGSFVHVHNRAFTSSVPELQNPCMSALMPQLLSSPAAWTRLWYMRDGPKRMVSNHGGSGSTGSGVGYSWA